jgi:hypothetical protein
MKEKARAVFARGEFRETRRRGDGARSSGAERSEDPLSPLSGSLLVSRQ